MRGRAHLAIGVLSGATILGGLALVGVPLHLTDVEAGAVVAGLGALLPDLDHLNSKASKSIPTRLLVEAGTFAAMIVGLWFLLTSLGGTASGAAFLSGVAPMLRILGRLAILGVVLLVLSVLIRSFTGHRGATHSLVAAGAGTLVAFVGCALLSVPPWYALLVGWGWLTHLAADATTHDGVPQLMWLLGPTSPSLSVASLPTKRPAPARLTSGAPVAPDSRINAAAPASPEFATPLCPSCGTPMVLRTAKRGPHVGERFYGCVNYPKCRQTRKIAT